MAAVSVVNCLCRCLCLCLWVSLCFSAPSPRSLPFHLLSACHPLTLSKQRTRTGVLEYRTVCACFSDGSRIAKSTPVDVLLRSDFRITINDQQYFVSPPETSKSSGSDHMHHKLFHEIVNRSASMIQPLVTCIVTVKCSITVKERFLLMLFRLVGCYWVCSDGGG